MLISDGDHDLMMAYLLAFVDMSSGIYRDDLKTFYEEREGLPRRVLWDCFVNPKACSLQACMEILRQRPDILAFADPYSGKDPDAFSIERLKDADEIKAFLNAVGENGDAYFFDVSFTWSLAVTHEFNAKNRRLCLSVNRP